MEADSRLWSQVQFQKNILYIGVGSGAAGAAVGPQYFG